MSAARRSGPSRSAGPPRQPVSRPSGSTPRASGGDPMRRIVLWFMSTVTVLVLLFGYHTSTTSQPASGGNTAVSAPAGAGSSGSTGAGTGSGTTGSGTTGTGTTSGSAET